MEGGRGQKREMRRTKSMIGRGTREITRSRAGSKRTGGGKKMGGNREKK